MNFREITKNDIEDLFRVRTNTDENNYSIKELRSLGITRESVEKKLNSTYKGWLCEIDNKIVGFSMGDKSTGEMWVIAVLPEYINRGIGSRLLQMVETWLFSEGCEKLWLTTDTNTRLRAYSFYIKKGWKDDAIKDGLRYMIKNKK